MHNASTTNVVSVSWPVLSSWSQWSKICVTGHTKHAAKTSQISMGVNARRITNMLTPEKTRIKTAL